MNKQIVRYMTPPFGQYTALSASLAGSLRHSHSRLVEFAEEIAFLRGEETEKMLLEREYAGKRQFDEKVQIECRNKLKRQYQENDIKKIIDDLWRKGTVQVFEIQ